MKFTQYVGKKLINRNKVTTDNLNWPFQSYMGSTKCCLSLSLSVVFQ